MGYVPLRRSNFKDEDEYLAYLRWAVSQTWSGRLWLYRYDKERKKA